MSDAQDVSTEEGALEQEREVPSSGHGSVQPADLAVPSAEEVGNEVAAQLGDVLHKAVTTPTKRGRNTLLALSALVVVGAGLAYARPMVVPLLIAAFIAVVTAPLVLLLRERGVPASLAVTAGVLVDVLAVTVGGVLVGGSLGDLTERLPFYQDRLGEIAVYSADWLDHHGVHISEEDLAQVLNAGAVLDAVGKLLRSLASLVSQLVLVLVIVAFMLVESTYLREKLLAVLHHSEDITALKEAASEVNSYLFVKTGTSLATGILLGIWCTVWEIDLPLLWGLVAFLLNFIPTIGSIIAALPPMLLALILHGWGDMLGVGAGYIAVNFMIGNVLEPRFMGRALGLSPLVVFLSMIVWGYLLGPVGALFSGPLTMLVKTFLEHTDDVRWLAVLLGPNPATLEPDANRSLADQLLDRISIPPPPEASEGDEAPLES